MRNGLQSFLSLPLISRKKIENEEKLIEIKLEKEPEQIKLKEEFVLPLFINTKYEYTEWNFINDYHLESKKISSLEEVISLKYYGEKIDIICDFLNFHSDTHHVITLENDREPNHAFIIYVNGYRENMLFVLYNKGEELAQSIVKLDYSKLTTLSDIRNRRCIIDSLISSILIRYSYIYKDIDKKECVEILKKIFNALNVSMGITV